VEQVCAQLREILERRGGVVVHKESVREMTKMTEAPRSIPPVRHAPLFVSFATRGYIPSILKSLDTLKVTRTRECPGLQYLLYVGSDVSDADAEPIQSIGSWISIRKLPMDVSPAGDSFPDFWTPCHFGWKLWILNQVVHEFTDKLIVYSDAGAQWQRLYDELFTKAWDTGVCFVIDNNLNKHWCSPAMIESMNVTAEELEAPQIAAAILAVHGGHAGACAFFKECYQLALNPVNLKGRKLIRILPSGQPVGHRHDQSIMSVMRVRNGGSGFGTVGVDEATCRESLRRTHLTQCPIYHHRGSYTVHKRPLPRTDDVWIINLNRRIDRIRDWAKSYPELAAITQRFQAIDGRELHMTPAISELFQRNDFQWKRSVVGCALSHILLWAQLACETSAVESYLILEDDMRFGYEDWADALHDALGSLPEDVDVAMLGGVLPNNRAVYAEAITSVNDIWAKIKPNTLFTKTPMPVFHHCAYSYYLTKRGAKKLLRALLTSEGGCFTSIDHFLGFPHSGYVQYVMTEPIVQCFQESDPRYVNSQFDNFDRVDSFDSDIWNNNEVFSQVDHECGTIYGARQSLYPVLSDVLRQVPSDVQTRSLLEPEQYMRAVVGDEGGEMEFLRTFAKILENEVRDPASIRIWQRKNVCCIAEGDSGINESVLAEICGDDVKVVRVATDGAYVYAKLFAVHPAMTVQEIIDRVDMTGCIPLYLRAEGDDVFWGQLRGTLPVMELRTVDAVRKFIAILQRDLKKAEMYRAGLLQKVRGGGA
jgi:GR25 family glycosyltransferase involved in LPS biosynthesis